MNPQQPNTQNNQNNPPNQPPVQVADDPAQPPQQPMQNTSAVQTPVNSQQPINQPTTITQTNDPADQFINALGSSRSLSNFIWISLMLSIAGIIVAVTGPVYRRKIINGQQQQVPVGMSLIIPILIFAVLFDIVFFTWILSGLF